MLRVMLQVPKKPTVVADEDVFDSLIEQLSDLGDSEDDDVLLIAPLGATQEQVDKAMAEIDDMEECEGEETDGTQL